MCSDSPDNDSVHLACILVIIGARRLMQAIRHVHQHQRWQHSQPEADSELHGSNATAQPDAAEVMVGMISGANVNVTADTTTNITTDASTGIYGSGDVDVDIDYAVAEMPIVAVDCASFGEVRACSESCSNVMQLIAS